MHASFYARGLGLDLSAADSVALAARHGFAAVDLMVRDLRDRGEDPREIRARMDDLGVLGGAWALPVDWKGDSERFEGDLRALPGLAATARALGLARTSTWVLPGGTFPGVAEDRECRLDAHADRLGRIAAILGREGTRLGLEVIGAETFRSVRGAPFLHRLADPDLRALIDRLNGGLPAGLPRVGVVVDSFHLLAAGESVEEALGAYGVEEVVWAHVADLPAEASGDRAEILDHDRGLPGESGRAPCAEMLRALANRGYSGPVSPEPLAGCRGLRGLSPEEVARRARESLRLVWPGTHGGGGA
jgi:sugar phosphate isomerase/epimerase